MKLYLTSDTHNSHGRLPKTPADIFIVSGDVSMGGTTQEILYFASWLAEQSQWNYKICVAGNHDFLFEKQPRLARQIMRDNGIIYLQDEEVTIEGLRIYGSPWTPKFFDWAFMLQRGSEILEKWKKIPEEVDVLITHGPPRRILDRTLEGDIPGCFDLRNQIFGRINPKIHVFGHIHEGYGRLEINDIQFINASFCTRDYLPVNEPVMLEL